MNLSKDRIDDFKANIWNQLANRDPVAFLALAFLCFIGLVTVIAEIAVMSPAGWPKYPIAALAAGLGLLRARLRWKAIEKRNENANTNLEPISGS